MTLGDRVAVMRAGIVQQVDSPRVLYDDPVNLFVAGFIGSPSMNFLPGRLEGDRIRLPLGEAQLPDQLRSQLQGGGGARDVVVGIRPEHFEDAAVAGEGHAGGLTARVKVAVVESMGSELYVYFDVQSEGPRSEDLSELAGDTGMDDLPSHGGGTTVVARLDAASRAAAGEEIEVVLDTESIKLFDPSTGRSLTVPE
jgi:multiple sugar transport system ATP-binding protein